MIVVVTHSQDLTVDFVIRHLLAQGEPFLRLDTDTLCTADRHFGFRNGIPTLTYGANVFTAHQVTNVWARRFARPNSIAALPSEYNQFVQREIRELTEAFIDAVSGLVVNSYETDRRAGNRITQSIAAAKVGFVVPKTVATQKESVALDFVARQKSVTKAISFGILTDDKEQVVHTTSVSQSGFQGLEICPVLLQENIEKRHEWRVTTVGSRVFSARTRLDVEIDKTDWRRSKYLQDIFEVALLPTDVEQRLVALCKETGLLFGAHDLIERPDGSFVFLETNPAGQWGWLELALGLPIGEAVATLLRRGEAPWSI